MKFINPFVHGVVDYLVVAAFAAAPTLFGFTGMTGNVCYATNPTALYFFSGFGAAVFVAWLTTNYNAGSPSTSQFGSNQNNNPNTFRKTG